MNLSDFDFNLPTSLIATHPPENRTDARLIIPPQPYFEGTFKDIEKHLHAGNLLVFNNTKVINARLQARTQNGKQTEVFVERILSSNSALCQIKNKKQYLKQFDAKLQFPAEVRASIKGDKGTFSHLEFHNLKTTLLEYIQKHGTTPLPPYIKRTPTPEDKHRYQTVYATHPGSVAAPTAGFHFDQALRNTLRQKGVEFAEITLHIGAGTFQPIRTPDITQHQMHEEHYCLNLETTKVILKAHKAGRRIIAVGTTTLRALESWAQKGCPSPYQGTSRLFIHPGFRFALVTSLITNFHMPKSSLFILISAFMGVQNAHLLYQHAINKEYRFYSYGDVMLINKNL